MTWNIPALASTATPGGLSKAAHIHQWITEMLPGQEAPDTIGFQEAEVTKHTTPTLYAIPHYDFNSPQLSDTHVHATGVPLYSRKGHTHVEVERLEDNRYQGRIAAYTIVRGTMSHTIINIHGLHRKTGEPSRVVRYWRYVVALYQRYSLIRPTIVVGDAIIATTQADRPGGMSPTDKKIAQLLARHDIVDLASGVNLAPTRKPIHSLRGQMSRIDTVLGRDDGSVVLHQVQPHGWGREAQTGLTTYHLPVRITYHIDVQADDESREETITCEEDSGRGTPLPTNT